ERWASASPASPSSSNSRRCARSSASCRPTRRWASASRAPEMAGAEQRSGGGVLGILAGAGPVPRRLIQECRRRGRPLCVVAFENQTDRETVAEVPHLWTRLGAAGEALAFLRAQGVEELVL